MSVTFRTRVVLTLILTLVVPAMAAAAATSRPASHPIPPSPDFKTRIDYRAWFYDNLCPGPDQHAWEAYQHFITDHRDKAAWDFKDMFNDQARRDPGPWEPAEHPDWEQSYQASRQLMVDFRKAARDPRPFCNARSGPRAAGEGELLVDMLLPSLRDLRALSRAVLAQAWRVQGTAPSPQAMRDALKATLGMAGQLRQDPILISQLVALATSELAYTNARWALHLGVFKKGDIQTTLAVLTAGAPPEPPLDLAGEHALALDMIQAFFPPNRLGKPKLDTKGLAKLRERGLEIPPELVKAKEADAWTAVKSANAYFADLQKAWATGMPKVRIADLDALRTKHLTGNVVGAWSVPDLNRSYVLQHRIEASRRATMLAYHLALHKAKASTYPAKLGDLKLAKSDDVRIDPFTGKYFGYRLENGEPLVYSLSENGKDDGGKHSPKWGDDANGGPDDYVFWPPQATQAR